MTTTAATIDTYLSAYGESDGRRRKQLIADSFAPDATLADPPLDAVGHHGLDEMFVAVQTQFPGHTFRRSSGIDEHHGVARYEWELVAADGTVSVSGTDVVRFDADDKLASVVGFFGPLPPLDA
jgi:hypothetical protein